MSEPRHLGLFDLLEPLGFEIGVPTKMLRHSGDDIDQLVRSGQLEAYQSQHAKPILHGYERIVSFYAISGRMACFYGVYQNVGRALKPPSESIWNMKAAFHHYDLRRDVRFDWLQRRLVVDWGPGLRGLDQRLRDKPVIELKPPGRSLPAFSDYLEFSLSFDELCDLYSRSEAHADWRTSLSAVAGVYLILAESTGQLYVGSASGAEGVWGRWREYVQNGHGGNLELRDLIERNVEYPKAFRFSLLQILPRSRTRVEVIRHEGRLKAKLGSRATGLNSN